ncbi:MAG: flagellar motor protein MotA [Legionellales bacterium]|jgi:biopolymer transport protein ExbB|nr:flagellar motor protein MotA [Legionellales bacterium]|tara:strand:- start:4997 stop:6439 length:1443 start_codon:yes stop_codon:yes gene_type:complete
MNRYINIIFILLISSTYAAEPTNLDELLEQVKRERVEEKEALINRESKFKNARNEQKKLLSSANKKLKEEEDRSVSLKATYESYDIEIKKQKEILDEKMGTLGELDGIVKQIAAELDSIIDTSLVSAQKPDRDKILDILSTRKELPSYDELEELWLLAMDEMVESGKVVQFKGKIITAAGNEVEQDITRIGVFNAVSDGRFLRSLPESGILMEPGRQPGQRFLEMAREIKSPETGIYPFPIDPTRGAMLALLVQVPDLKNRIEQGGLIGYVILIIGFVGLLLAIERLIVLFITARKVNEQLQKEEPDENALGRIMLVYKNNPEIDAETLGLKLDEAILKEMPKLQRGLWTIALLAAVSPLLGLLGTVTGIIETFQSITLYGTGDPRVMSGGISQALVTTVMGLLVAIPLLLFHGYLSSKSNTLIQILDEKSMAYVAILAEENRRKVFGQSSQHQNVKKEDKSKPSAADSDEPEFVIPDDG